MMIHSSLANTPREVVRPMSSDTREVWQLNRPEEALLTWYFLVEWKGKRIVKAAGPMRGSEVDHLKSRDVDHDPSALELIQTLGSDDYKVVWRKRLWQGSRKARNSGESVLGWGEKAR